jgi:putative glutamine amidotransferase
VAHDLASPAGRLVRHWPARFEVDSFHSFTISPGGLSSRLVPLAFADDGSIEAIGHVALPQIGVLWHPERDAQPAGGALDLLQIFC